MVIFTILRFFKEFGTVVRFYGNEQVVNNLLLLCGGILPIQVEYNMAVWCYGNAAFSSIGYFYRSLRCTRATVAPHQSCHAADSGTVCILAPHPTTTTSIISSLSLPPSCSAALCGPATLVMRPECTIRACHTPTAGAAPQPRPGYRLKHPLINTVLPLPPQHTRTHPPPLPVSLRRIQPIKRWRVA